MMITGGRRRNARRNKMRTSSAKSAKKKNSNRSRSKGSRRRKRPLKVRGTVSLFFFKDNMYLCIVYRSEADVSETEANGCR